MPFLLLLFTAIFSLGLSARENPYQVNWVPDNFFVVCEGKHPCELNREQSERVAELMSDAVNGMKSMPFDPPKDWGRRVGKGTANDYIELYQRGAGIASAAPQCGNAGRPRSTMQVGPDVLDKEYEGRDYLIYYFMAHEIFHLSQYGYAMWDQQLCDQYVPGWIMEGMATAVGLDVMRKRYPSVAPSLRSDREARYFSGLRRYDMPLPYRALGDDGEESFSGDFPQYFTASFWRHLAEAYHRGKYDYLHRYMKRSGEIGDWMPWLRNNIENDLEGDLGIVFSGFLADYAGWGDPGYPGAFYNRREWLKEAFGGCERVYLDKNKASGWVELEILPLSGKCIEVHVSALGEAGLKEGDSAAVQIAGIVMGGSAGARNGLHLSLAASNDKKNFHCAKEARAGRKFGIGKCILLPDDGELRLVGSPIDARVWNVRAQEPGGKPVVAGKGGDPADKRQQQGDGKGALVNLYTVSYTPLDVSTADTIYGGRNPVTARIYFVLDVARLAMEGSKKGAVGSFADGADPQTTLPKQDASGKRANSYSKPDQFQPSIAMPLNTPAQAAGKLSYFTVMTSAENAESNSGVTLIPGRINEKGEFEHHPLSLGETGSFPLSIHANIEGEPAVAVAPASLIVEEFSDLVFRARYSGSLCRHQDLIPRRPGDPAGDPCRNPFPVSGEIVKAFAGSRLPDRYMVVERTEGTEIYRRTTEQGMAEWMNPSSRSDDPDPGTGQPGSSSSKSGGDLDDCACTCEERAETLKQGEEIKARMAAGETVNPGETMGLMRCSGQCRSEYMMCVMEENEAEKARKESEQNAREEELSSECDCSCTALNSLESRSAELLQEMQSGSPTAMDKMKHLGQCMSVCQNEMMSCAKSR